MSDHVIEGDELRRPPRREDGWDERYATSMGGVSITYFENGVVKRAYPGANVTFTFPDGHAEQFGIGDRVVYPPPPGATAPPPRQGPLAYVARVVVKGVLFGVIMFVTYMIATILVM
jgi:hypothetical protein